MRKCLCFCTGTLKRAAGIRKEAKFSCVWSFLLSQKTICDLFWHHPGMFYMCVLIHSGHVFGAAAWNYPAATEPFIAYRLLLYLSFFLRGVALGRWRQEDEVILRYIRKFEALHETVLYSLAQSYSCPDQQNKQQKYNLACFYLLYPWKLFSIRAREMAQ